MKIIILCPLGVRTGGPEALHQLCDSLNQFGLDASMFYTTESDFSFISDINKSDLSKLVINVGDRANPIEEYKKYRAPVITELRFSEDTVFIFPETYLHWVPILHQSLSIIWWLSVDNAFKYLSMSTLNLNTLRSLNIIHAYQSDYACRFLESLNIIQRIKLTDYTIAPLSTINSKGSISINAGHKVIFDIDKITNSIKSKSNIKINLISGLSRSEVYDLLSSSFCFIDLGNFPGKDRLAREAALLKCIPVVLNVGGAQDYSLPSQLKISIDQIDSLPFLINSILDNYSIFLESIDNFIFNINTEKVEFMKEVSSLIRKIHFHST